MVRDLLQLNTRYKQLFMSGIAFLVVLAGLYGVFLKQTVATVVERRSLETARGELAADVSVLEADYINATEEITLTKARERGFVTSTDTRFVSRVPQKTVSFDYRRDE